MRNFSVAEVAMEPKEPNKTGRKPLVLVVDDERVIREGCSRICEAMGCEVIAVENGEEGLRAISENQVDVILLDIMMPGLSGIELMERVPKGEGAPVVVVITGYATVELAVQAMKGGAYDFIAKPFTPDQLRIVVKRALEKKALLEEAKRLRIERLRSLRDIAEEQSRLQSIIHSMADGVIVTDTQGTVVLHNPPAARLLGRAESSMLYRSIGELAPSEVSSMIMELAHMPPATARAVEAQIEKVGAIRVHGSPIHLADGERVGVVALIQDLTALRDLEKMKSDFVAMVAHELRAPLSAVQQQLEVITAGMVGELNQRQMDLLEKAKRRLEGLLQLIRDLLDLAKIEAGRVVEKREPLELTTLVWEVAHGFREMAMAKELSLVVEKPPFPLWVAGDPGALEEVFSNLISNAISYTPEGGKITVLMGTKGGYACVEVMDTGVGIPQECIPRIFDKFFRVRDDRTRHVVGTGLGLPIVKGIVEAHLGAVEVESTVGRGSTFRVLIPQVQTRHTAHLEKEKVPGIG